MKLQGMLASVFICVGLPVFADDNKGWFVGGSVGQVSTDDGDYTDNKSSGASLFGLTRIWLCS